MPYGETSPAWLYRVRLNTLPTQSGLQWWHRCPPYAQHQRRLLQRRIQQLRQQHRQRATERLKVARLERLLRDYLGLTYQFLIDLTWPCHKRIFEEILMRLFFHN